MFLVLTHFIQILLNLFFAFSFGRLVVAKGAVAKQLALEGFRRRNI